MSEIIITSSNISRFSKRLQKSLKNHFKQDVPLHLASLMLAQAFGLDSIHHLQQKLDHPTPDSVHSITSFITSYFKENTTSQIYALSLVKDRNELSFNISAKSPKHGDIEGFGIFMGEPPTYVPAEMARLQLTMQDEAFIQELVKKLRFDDLAENAALAVRLKEALQLNTVPMGFHEFTTNQASVREVANYAVCESFLVLVNGDFFERVGAPFTLHNDHYSFIDLSTEPAQLFTDMETAMEHLQDGQIIIEFLTAIPTKRNTKYKKEGIGGYYIFKDKGNMKACTMNGSYEHPIKSLADYFFFLGMDFFNKHSNMAVNQRFSTNHPYLSHIKAGRESCIASHSRMGNAMMRT